MRAGHDISSVFCPKGQSGPDVRSIDAVAVGGMNEKNNFALVPRPSSAVEKAAPGAKRVLAVMVAEALALARSKSNTQPDSVSDLSEEAEDFYRRGLECENRGDRSQAFQFYKQAAEKGDSWAQYKVGHSYLYGDIIPQNYDEGVKWIRKAAENGEDVAQVVLGVLCLLGEGVPKDYVESAKWFGKATVMGKDGAQALLNFFDNQIQLPKNQNEFVKCLQEGAEQGNTGTQWLLGECYRKGWFVPRNDAEAAKWYRNFAECGSAEAQLRLAWCYCDLDKSEHVKWLRRAAEQGDNSAQRRLSIINYMGYLPEDQRDIVEAYKWARVDAEESGLFENFENMKEHMTTEQIKTGEALALEFLSKSAQ
jgi:TPR repeat protein